MKPLTRESFQSMLSNHNLENICDSDLRLIRGGDPTPAQISALLTSLQNIFEFAHWNPQVNVSAAYEAEFNAQVALLASTNVGYHMLNEIVNAGQKITITGVDVWATSGPPGTITGGALYYPETSNNQLAIGSLSLAHIAPPAWNANKLQAENFATIAHELFHAYMDVTGQLTTTYTNSIRRELDAYLFEFMASAEIDEKNGWNSTTDMMKAYTHWNSQIYTEGNNLNSTETFRHALYQMFHNRTFNLNYYNNLVQSFQSGSSVGTYTGNGNAIDQTTFDNSAMKLFWQDYSTSSYFNNILPPAMFNTTFSLFGSYNTPGSGPGDGSYGGGPTYGGYTGSSFGQFMNYWWTANGGTYNTYYSVTIQGLYNDGQGNWYYNQNYQGSVTFDLQTTSMSTYFNLYVGMMNGYWGSGGTWGYKSGMWGCWGPDYNGY